MDKCRQKKWKFNPLVPPSYQWRRKTPRSWRKWSRSYEAPVGLQVAEPPWLHQRSSAGLVHYEVHCSSRLGVYTEPALVFACLHFAEREWRPLGKKQTDMVDEVPELFPEKPVDSVTVCYAARQVRAAQEESSLTGVTG